jgi:hypothetical protein
MTKATKHNPAAARQLSRPLNVVGPYSLWPRDRGVSIKAPIIASVATVSGAALAHCVLPALT